MVLCLSYKKMSYCVLNRLFWEHLFLAQSASVNPVPAQAIADIPEKVLQTDFNRDLSLQNNTLPR